MNFDIKTTQDFFKKLLADHKEFCEDKTNSRKALNCTSGAWHITW
jgi:hypothetical protein